MYATDEDKGNGDTYVFHDVYWANHLNKITLSNLFRWSDHDCAMQFRQDMNPEKRHYICHALTILHTMNLYYTLSLVQHKACLLGPKNTALLCTVVHRCQSLRMDM